jgi:hypothetical protein
MKPELIDGDEVTASEERQESKNKLRNNLFAVSGKYAVY